VLNYENDIKKVTQFKGLTEELAQVKKDKNRKALEAREAEQVHEVVPRLNHKIGLHNITLFNTYRTQNSFSVLQVDEGQQHASNSNT